MSKDLMGILDRMTGARVLVVGDVMLDRFVYGAAERISPEGPVPVLRITRENSMLGGAGNVLSNLAGLNVGRAIIGVIGQDGPSWEVKDLVAELGGEKAGLIEDEARPTTLKTRYLAGGQQLLRTDFEKSEAISESVQAAVLKHYETELAHAGAVVVSDYGKGMLSAKLIRAIIDRAQKKKIPVLVDPKGHDYRRYKGASVVTPNKKELSEATGGMAVNSDEEVTAAAQSLIKECGIESVLATRSQDGMSIVRKQFKQPVHLETAPVEVYDVSGAGDTVIAVAAAAMAAGADLVQAARLANSAGSIVVTKVGTAPIRMGELREAVAMQTGGAAKLNKAPICDQEEAHDVCQRWRARGQKIGLTNGCFDILHRGHVDYLCEARALCDKLVLALNTDASVKLLKGEDRPVHDEVSRAQVLAGLAAVDMVVFFGAQEEGQDNTPAALISKLQPDIYFKGGDYTIDQLPENKVVSQYGGEVHILSLFEGHSTTASLNKIKATEKKEAA